MAIIVRRLNPMRVLALCCVAGLIVGVVLLEGTTQGLVLLSSGVLLMVAVAVGFDSKDSRSQERHLDSAARPSDIGGS